MKYLLDSNIIIYHLNGDKIATDFIMANMSRCAISQITYVELDVQVFLSFLRKQESRGFQRLPGFRVSAPLRPE